jgi:hypothetical protein
MRRHDYTDESVWIQTGKRVPGFTVHGGGGMLFTPELRRTLESAFLPLACECTVMPGGALMVKIFEPQTGEVAMRVENVRIDNLTTMRGVAELVAELRYDLRTCVTPFGSTPAFFAAPRGA